MKHEVITGGIWRRSHYLDRMTLKELWIAYFQYPAIIAYILIAAVVDRALVRLSGERDPRLSPRLRSSSSPIRWSGMRSTAGSLHSRWMFKVPALAATWKRIHYDHHQDPNHLEVLFGALYTTLPTIGGDSRHRGRLCDRRHRRRGGRARDGPDHDLRL